MCWRRRGWHFQLAPVSNQLVQIEPDTAFFQLWLTGLFSLTPLLMRSITHNGSRFHFKSLVWLDLGIEPGPSAWKPDALPLNQKCGPFLKKYQAKIPGLEYVGCSRPMLSEKKKTRPQKAFWWTQPFHQTPRSCPVQTTSTLKRPQLVMLQKSNSPAFRPYKEIWKPYIFDWEKRCG